MQILLQQPLYTVQQSVDKKPKVTPSEAAREYRKLHGERPAVMDAFSYSRGPKYVRTYAELDDDI